MNAWMWFLLLILVIAFFARIREREIQAKLKKTRARLDSTQWEVEVLREARRYPNWALLLMKMPHKERR